MKTKGAITRRVIARKRSDGGVFGEYRSASEAARKTGVTNETVLNHCHGRTKNPTVWTRTRRPRRVTFEFVA